MKWETNAMESTMKDKIEDGGSLLNQANARPFSVISKAQLRIGSWYPCNSIWFL